MRLAVGHAVLESEVTGEGAEFAYAALHLGDHNVSAGVIEYPGDADYQARAAELEAAFGTVDVPQIIRLIDRDFGEARHSVESLFRDMQRHVLKQLVHPQLSEITGLNSRLYEQNLPLLRFLKHLCAPIPLPMQATAEVLFNTDLRWALKDDDPDFEQIRKLIHDAKSWGVRLDTQGLGFRFSRMLTRAAERWRDQPDNADLVAVLSQALDLVHELPFEPNLWSAQNAFFDLTTKAWPDKLAAAAGSDALARAWIAGFLTIGEKLKIDVEGLKKQLA